MLKFWLLLIVVLFGVVDLHYRRPRGYRHPRHYYWPRPHSIRQQRINRPSQVSNQQQGTNGSVPCSTFDPDAGDCKCSSVCKVEGETPQCTPCASPPVGLICAPAEKCNGTKLYRYGECPMSYTEFEGLCYRAFKQGDTSIGGQFWNAHMFCRLFGKNGGLVAIETDLEADFVEGLINNELSSAFTWIGASVTLGLPAKWIRTGQIFDPLNNTGNGITFNRCGGSGSCVFDADEFCLSTTTTMVWDDLSCTRLRDFICEAEPTCDTPSKCPIKEKSTYY